MEKKSSQIFKNIQHPKEKLLNVNCLVKLAITTKGFKCWKKYYNKYSKNFKSSKFNNFVTIAELRSRSDKDGYSTLQLWEVMEIFGEDLQANNYFATDIKINELDLK